MVNRISSERVHFGKTQTDLAKELGVTRETISAWENGGEIPVSALRKMAKEIFHCSADWLIGLSETRSAKQES